MFPFKPLLLVLVFGLSQCTPDKSNSDKSSKSQAIVHSEVEETLTAFHAAAAKSDLEAYFDFFSEDAVFLGTDATEYWDKSSFYAYAQAPFAAGRGWKFRALQRHIYLSEEASLAWFDELLDAPYAKIARGSGVLLKTDTGWKIKQYVLSMTVPNALSDSIVTIKAATEQLLIDSMKSMAPATISNTAPKQN